MNKITKNMPDAEYFAIPALNNSTLGKMEKTPYHCKYASENPMEPTANMQLGSLVHTLVLEPNEYSARYHVEQYGDPTLPRNGSPARLAIIAINEGTFERDYYTGEPAKKPRAGSKAMEIAQLIINGVESLNYMTEPAVGKKTKEDKQIWADFTAKCESDDLIPCKQSDMDAAIEYAEYIERVGDKILLKNEDKLRAENYIGFMQAINGKIVITEDTLATANLMRESVLNHPAASKLLTNGDAEVVLEWVDEETGLPCKCKIDYMRHDDLLVDLKTTQDACKDSFSKSIANFGYHRQDAFYTEGFEKATERDAKGFVFIVVESKPPHLTAVYNLDIQDKAKGAEEVRDLRSQYATCLEADYWPGHSDRVETIELPRWYK